MTTTTYAWPSNEEFEARGKATKAKQEAADEMVKTIVFSLFQAVVRKKMFMDLIRPDERTYSVEDSWQWTIRETYRHVRFYKPTSHHLYLEDVEWKLFLKLRALVKSELPEGDEKDIIMRRLKDVTNEDQELRREDGRNWKPSVIGGGCFN